MLADEKFVKECYQYFKTDMSYFNKSELVEGVQYMNEKISMRTNGMIPQAVKSLAETDLLMINSLAIDLPWLPSFVKTTKKMTFTTTDGTKLAVPAITVSSKKIKLSEITVGRTKQTDMRMIQVPYATKEGEKSNMEMRIFMGPKQVRQSGVQFLLDKNQNTDNIFQQQPGREEDKEITLVLPSFSSRSEVDMASFLKSQGIEKIFSSEAELTGFTKDEKRFSVKNINQEVFVNVTEYGTVMLHFHVSASLVVALSVSQSVSL